VIENNKELRVLKIFILSSIKKKIRYAVLQGNWMEFATVCFFY
jgi:hypothetical protein